MTHAFVYKWTNTSTQEYYIGVHKGTPDDGYIGSGKKFRLKYLSCPELFKREIIQSFSTYEDALIFEESLVTQEVISDKLCLNLKTGGSGGGVAGWASRVNTKQRVLNRKENARKRGISYCQHRIGTKFTEETKKILSEKAKSRPKVECPNCKKVGSISQMKQWHFLNCKELSVEVN